MAPHMMMNTTIFGAWKHLVVARPESEVGSSQDRDGTISPGVEDIHLGVAAVIRDCLGPIGEVDFDSLWPYRDPGVPPPLAALDDFAGCSPRGRQIRESGLQGGDWIRDFAQVGGIEECLE